MIRGSPSTSSGNIFWCVRPALTAVSRLRKFVKTKTRVAEDRMRPVVGTPGRAVEKNIVIPPYRSTFELQVGSLSIAGDKNVVVNIHVVNALPAVAETQVVFNKDLSRIQLVVSTRGGQVLRVVASATLRLVDRNAAMLFDVMESIAVNLIPLDQQMVGLIERYSTAAAVMHFVVSHDHMVASPEAEPFGPRCVSTPVVYFKVFMSNQSTTIFDVC